MAFHLLHFASRLAAFDVSIFNTAGFSVCLRAAWLTSHYVHQAPPTHTSSPSVLWTLLLTLCHSCVGGPFWGKETQAQFDAVFPEGRRGDLNLYHGVPGAPKGINYSWHGPV